MAKPGLVFETHSWPTFAEAKLGRSEILFAGENVDDRGSEAIKALSSIADVTITLGYIPEKNELLIDGKDQPLSQLVTICKGKLSIRIETTTLGLAEILKIVQAAQQAGVSNLEFIYIEPKEYTVFARTGGEYLNPWDFELTDNRVFRSVHGFAHQRGVNVKECYVFFLGYESSRLLQAFEQPEFKVDEQFAIFGLPPFVSGWETNALANHAADLKNLKFRPTSIRYCAANSAREAYLTLWEIYERVGNEHLTFVVSPIGTKPHTLATALFLVETKGSPFSTALYYDHPKRRLGRSRDLRMWHVYRVSGFN
jgi:hypothetical protein